MFRIATIVLIRNIISFTNLGRQGRKIKQRKSDKEDQVAMVMVLFFQDLGVQEPQFRLICL